MPTRKASVRRTKPVVRKSATETSQETTQQALEQFVRTIVEKEVRSALRVAHETKKSQKLKERAEVFEPPVRLPRPNYYRSYEEQLACAPANHGVTWTPAENEGIKAAFTVFCSAEGWRFGRTPYAILCKIYNLIRADHGLSGKDLGDFVHPSQQYESRRKKRSNDDNRRSKGHQRNFWE